MMGQFCISSPWHTGTGCTASQNDAKCSWNKIHLWLLNTKDFPLGETQPSGGLETFGEGSQFSYFTFLPSPVHLLLTTFGDRLLGWLDFWVSCFETNLGGNRFGKNRGHQIMKSPQDIWLSCCSCLKRVSGEGGGDAVLQIHQVPFPSGTSLQAQPKMCRDDTELSERSYCPCQCLILNFSLFLGHPEGPELP